MLVGGSDGHAVSQIINAKDLQKQSQWFHKLIVCDDYALIQLPVVMSLEGHGTETSSSEIKATSSYAADTSKLPIEGTAKSYQSIKNDAEQMGMTEPVQEYGVTQQKRTAKIHDFCFGIPYALSTGVLFGGALLALSTLSLKIWRQGKSSLPFVLGQAGGWCSKEASDGYGVGLWKAIRKL
ncbi:Protein fatty acid export 1, chloroplastic [Vitis vinifera]|uniref:Protein fatty acid export 1, chloroplastic n=1 Tax=Vitis vinifera TaxID=29760 RepID=A0A438BZV8_VITVI|nr:Protein fatty acid export 1, chloroplastic [Vitis vinifera]